MNKKVIIAIVGILAFIAGAVWIARPDTGGGASASSVPLSSGVLTMELSAYDFGRISIADGVVTTRVGIKNTGSKHVVIRKIYTSCMCTEATLVLNENRQFGPFGMPGHGSIPSIDEPIAPGEEAIIEISFDPAAHGPAGVGRIQRTVIVENDAGEPLKFSFNALVRP